MIGVISKNTEEEVVKEFFQLFKTPWEFYKEGKYYDAVISSRNQIADIETKILIIYSSICGEWDAEQGLIFGSIERNTFLNFNGEKAPIYGQIATFKGQIQPLFLIDKTSEAAGVEINLGTRRILRLGYDLFQEVDFLLSSGQPVENALLPTLEIHIAWLRTWIVNTGIPVVEIPPVPADYDFITCLTHDVDFIGIRYHKFDHTMWGFIYRAIIGSLFSMLKRRISYVGILKNWKATLALPLVFLGWTRDFWLQFDRFLSIEKNLRSTFFLIPFKNRSGDTVDRVFKKRRAARYDIADISDWVKKLSNQGCEIAVHGIDAWHSPEKGRKELKRISEYVDTAVVGVRMHWLCFNSDSPQILESAGYEYDSTLGYNNAVGYVSGTTQAFRPKGTKKILELPFHIQDTALFYPRRMGLSEILAWKICIKILENAKLYGGILTIIWHQRSLAPERLWGDFYIKLLNKLQAQRTWFATARQVVEWFQKRRNIVFKAVSVTDDNSRLQLEFEGHGLDSDLTIRVHLPQSCYVNSSRIKQRYIDVPVNGQRKMEISLI